MNPIVLAILIVSVIGLIAGLGLAVASIVMAVPVDKKAEAIRECLPGANCGACGFRAVTAMRRLFQRVLQQTQLSVPPAVTTLQRLLQRLRVFRPARSLPWRQLSCVRASAARRKPRWNTTALAHVKWQSSFSAVRRSASTVV